MKDRIKKMVQKLQADWRWFKLFHIDKGIDL